MSQADVEVVTSYYEAADLAKSIQLLGEDVEFVFHGEARKLAGAETLVGKEAAVAWLGDWFSRFDSDYRMAIEESLDWGDRVLVVTTHQTKGRASGVPVSERTAQVMTVRDGLIVRQDFFGSREAAVEAAGPTG